MARISQCDKLPEHERLNLLSKLGEGISWRALAAEFGIPQATIRQWAERNGYQRSAAAAKRNMVDALLAGEQVAHQTARSTATAHPTTGNPDTDAAAERDASVARLAAGAAVAIIGRLSDLLETDLDAKDTNTVATALDRAWNTYARINKLDDAKPEATNDHSTMAEIVRRKLGI